MNPSDAPAPTSLPEVPKLAPLPNAHTGSHAVDAGGVRNLDSESHKPRLATKAKPTVKKTAPIASVPHIPTKDDETDCPLHDAALTRPFRPFASAEMNLFVPSALTMFSIITMMNNRYASLHANGLNGTADNWIPQVTQIYCSVLFYIQILRCEVAAGIASAGHTVFLRTFVENFPLETLPVPGPLVPFFRSISLTGTGLPGYNDVCPFLPKTYTNAPLLIRMATDILGTTNVYSGAHLGLPNIPVMFDQFFKVMNHVQAGFRYSNFVWLQHFFDLPIPLPVTTSQNVLSAKTVMQGAFFMGPKPQASDGLVHRYVNFVSAYAHDFPPARSVLNLNETWKATPIDNILEMSDRMRWFRVFIQGMNSFTAHWNGSTNLAKIPPVSSTAGLIVYSINRPSLIPRSGLFRSAQPDTDRHSVEYSYKASGENPCPYVPAEDLDDSQIAMVNNTLESAIPADANINDWGTLNVTRYGPYWTRSPVPRATEAVDLTERIESIITSTAFFNEKA